MKIQTSLIFFKRKINEYEHLNEQQIDFELKLKENPNQEDVLKQYSKFNNDLDQKMSLDLAENKVLERNMTYIVFLYNSVVILISLMISLALQFFSWNLTWVFITVVLTILFLKKLDKTL